MIAEMGSMDGVLSEADVDALTARAVESIRPAGKRVLFIIPDSTRTAPMPLLFRTLVKHFRPAAEQVDFLIALGTHPLMSEEKINVHLGLTAADRVGEYGDVGIFNHRWDLPDQMKLIGTISSEEVSAISGGLMTDEIPIRLNKVVYDYDKIIICGPVFPHEVVGFSGGNKYLFPGIAADNIINTSHWLAGIVTNPKIIGHKVTATRALINRAADMVAVEKYCFAFVVKGQELAGLFVDTPEVAWSAAADLSNELHVIYVDRPFETVLSCAPAMYTDIWVAGKCMYKLEPVVADGGELIIYGPHIRDISHTHGRLLEQVGYHVAGYFLNQWEAFKDYPWGILAHSSHVRGIGTADNGKERPRVRVTLATGISKEMCERINLGYRDPASIDPEQYANREEEGVLLVRKAGEKLYRLNNPPAWQHPDVLSPAALR